MSFTTATVTDKAIHTYAGASQESFYNRQSDLNNRISSQQVRKGHPQRLLSLWHHKLTRHLTTGERAFACQPCRRDGGGSNNCRTFFEVGNFEP